MSKYFKLFKENLIETTPLRRLALSFLVSTPIIIYQPIRSLFISRSDATKPDQKLKALIEEIGKKHNLNLSYIDVLVKDEVDFKLYPNWLGRATLVIPKYLTIQSLDDLNSSYLNKLIKKKYGVELKNNEQWFTDEGKRIISSFILTDEAKKFLISRNIHHLIDSNPAANSFLITLYLYTLGQFSKWYDDLVFVLNDQERIKRLKKIKKGMTPFWAPFLKEKSKANKMFLLAFWTNVIVTLYFGTGLQRGRDSDAKALSKNLANATTIKSKIDLIDFNCYSGGEEAYKKVVERNKSINDLFFEDMNNFERYYTGISIDKEGNELNPFSNELSVDESLKNINEWEIKS